MSLFCLGIGMMLAVFQFEGIWLVLRDRVKILVRNVMAVGPRCLRCLMLM